MTTSLPPAAPARGATPAAPRTGLSFLEAHRIVSGFAGGPPLAFLLATSGTPDTLALFLKAAAAQRGRSLELSTLPFNTLGQALLAPPAGTEVWVLLPWDLAPETDWRSGLPSAEIDAGAVLARADDVARRLVQRGARVLYVPAPVPPLFPDPRTTASLARSLLAVAHGAGATVLDADTFALGGYLQSGTPFASARLGAVADAVVAAAAGGVPSEPAKVLVTDLDNVLWRGVIGEDGLDGIACAPEGKGFAHFLYQTLLAKLKREGALLAAVSRNDAELALMPFRAGRTHLAEHDLVAIVASYSAKSAQIAELARQLNLGLDAFVFVDDNPIELEEVAAQLPAVRCVRFPSAADELPRLFGEISAHFARAAVTAEDRERTEMYRRRLEGMAPNDAAGADLTEFLRGLGMRLVLHDRSAGDRTRAVQLINKTNQFNANGVRVTDETVAEILAAGGALWGATLEDRTGSHGEILSLLVDGDGVARAMVLSCRVFQRRVEHAVLRWLIERGRAPRAFRYAETPRNEPFRRFIADAGFGAPDETGHVAFDADAFRRAHGDVLSLFTIEEPSAAR
jgi:FkbH-like protein